MKMGSNAAKASRRQDRSRRARPVQSITLPDNQALSLQEKLYQRLRDLIRSGTFPAGSRLASSRALASSLGISRNSVLVAIDRLIADGWLESRRNSGVYVVYSGNPFVAEEPKRSPATGIPFQMAWPTHVFPVRLWTRLQMRRWRDMPDFSLQQGERLGLPALRTAIAAHLTAARGLPCRADQVVVTTSLPAGIELAVQALGLSGGVAWIEDPSCEPGLSRTSMRLAPVAVDAEGFNVEAAKGTAPDACMARVGPACQAPTGVTLSEPRRQALLDWAETVGGWIFEDDFNYRVEPRRQLIPPLAASGRGRVLYFNSFNSLLFPGLRIAYIVIPPDLLPRFEAVQSFDGEVNASNQIVLTDFLEAGYFEDYLKRLVASDAERRTALMEAVTTTLGDFMTAPERDSEFFVCTLKTLSEPAVVEAAAAAGIVVTPMSVARRLPPIQQQILLGFSQHSPAAIAAAALHLRTALERISPRSNRGRAWV